MPSFKGIPTPPTSNTQKDLSTGLAGLLGGMFQGRRQKSQDALAQALQEFNMKYKEREMQHWGTTGAQGQQTIDQNGLNQKLQRLHEQFPDVTGNLSLLLDQSQPNAQPVGNRIQSGQGAQTPSLMDSFTKNVGEATKKMLDTHQTQTFEQNGQTFTVPNKEFNPSSMLGLDLREQKFKENMAKEWRNDPTNKIVMGLSANFARAYSALKSADTGDPAAYNSALLNFATAVDPTLRSAQWTIQKMTNIDPSISGQISLFLDRIKDGTIPLQQRQNMVEHLHKVVEGVMQDYDLRRQGWIDTHPGYDQEVMTPTSAQLFPSFNQLVKPNQPQSQGQGVDPEAAYQRALQAIKARGNP